MLFIPLFCFQESLAEATFWLFCTHICSLRLSRQSLGSLRHIDTIFTEVGCWHLTVRQQESRTGEGTSKRKMCLLCLLPVDGAVQLLHLAVSEDTISEVRLKLLHGQLPVICKEKAFITWMKNISCIPFNVRRLLWPHNSILIPVRASEELPQMKLFHLNWHWLSVAVSWILTWIILLNSVNAVN